MTIDELIIEAYSAKDRFWFIDDLQMERTDSTIRLRFSIGPKLFIQVFFSERSGRFSLALIDSSMRLYGRDREHGLWHRHPFEDPSIHEPTPEGMSPHPIIQFITEVEELLLDKHVL
jgi:hypothetical protein